MRINKYLAASTGLSRRSADMAVAEGRVYVNAVVAIAGQDVADSDVVTLDGTRLVLPVKTRTILLHKPAGYVVSRTGQGSQTIYDLLPRELHALKPIGRLDKDSSGLLLLTSDGQLAQELTHPKYQKIKVYIVTLSAPLTPKDLHQLAAGVQLEDGPSHLKVTTLAQQHADYQVTMHEGRNRQIRRTFAALGYHVIRLHRTRFGGYTLDALPAGQYRVV
jgi:23S rRNA pseudouridine2605 synthase